MHSSSEEHPTEGPVPLSVLVVDDEPLFMQRVFEAADALGCIHADYASTVSTAVEKLESRRYDAVVVDVYMPPGDRAGIPPELEIPAADEERSGVALAKAIIARKLACSRSLGEPPPRVLLCTRYLLQAIAGSEELANSPYLSTVAKDDLRTVPEELVRLLSATPSQTGGSVALQSRATHDAGASRASSLRPEARFPSSLARMLHDHGRSLGLVESAVHTALTLPPGDPFRDVYEPPRSMVESVFAEKRAHLLDKLRKLVGTLATESDRRHVQTEELDLLRATIERLLAGGVPETFVCVDQLRAAARLASEVAGEFQHRAPRELIRAIKAGSMEIERYHAMYALHLAWVQINEMQNQAKTFRDYVIASIRPSPPKEAVYLATLLREAVQTCQGYASRAGVELRPQYRTRDMIVDASANDLRRAIENVINNAIKYTHSMPAAVASRPWVDVTLRAREGAGVIEVGNWGVPIGNDEIEEGLIFEEGYRGRYSTDKGRSGSGIGLADAFTTVTRHRGRILVRSHPSPPGRPDDYKGHYLTTVTVEIPLAGGAPRDLS